MIGVISEKRYDINELTNLRRQGCVVNYTLVPQYYQDYNAELTKANNALIYRASALIFRIETFFAGTKEALERALYYKKPCKVIYQDKTYVLNTLDDWRYSRGYGKDAIHYKHPLLQEYEAQRKDYFEFHDRIVAKEQYELAVADVKESEEEVYRLVNNFKHLYDIDVNMDNKREVYLAYKSISFYLENDIEYSNEPQGEEFPYEIVSFGDPVYLEDYIYKNKVVS